MPKLSTLYRQALPFGNRKIYVIGPFWSVLPHFRKYHPSGNLKLNNLGIFRRVKRHNLMGKILPIPLKLHFTRNTLGCYGLNITVMG